MFPRSDSEDNGNYDDFMYSDDDAMSSGDDMEFESDNDNNSSSNNNNGGNVPQENADEIPLDRRYDELMEVVDELFEVHNFALAREKLAEFPSNEAFSSKTVFKVHLKELESWVQELKFCTTYPSAKDVALTMIESMSIFTYSEDLIEDNEVLGIVKLVDDLIIGKEFSSKCGLLFNLTEERKAILLKSIEFYRSLLSELEGVLNFEFTPSWIGRIVFLYKYKIHYLTIVDAIVKDKEVPQTTMKSLQTMLDHTTNLLSVNGSGLDPKLLVDLLRIKTEAIIYQFIRHGGSPSSEYREGVENNVMKLDDLIYGSSTLKHDPKLIVISKTGCGIHYMPRSILDDVESTGYGPGSSRLDTFLERMKDTKKMFIEALTKFEEIGYGRSSSSDLQTYHKLLVGFIVLSSMVQLKTNKLDFNVKVGKIPVVDPFTFEEIRIIEDTPFVQLLKKINQDWLKCDVAALYDDFNQFGQLKITLGYFLEKILILTQSMKLWTQIAPNYNCLSVKDICKQLTYDKEKPMTRDGLLTLLMTSIMRGNADVYYKIDFIDDVVYFGDEYKVPLTLSSHHQPSLKGKDELTSYEFANDVGVRSVESIHFDLDVRGAYFFDQLKQARIEHTHVPSPVKTELANTDIAKDGSQPTAKEQQAKLHEKYMQLVGMAEKNIDKLERKQRDNER
ncbi:similar to Saccharomyces cerevisiae YOL117W RRI2 Subunit of the COP9 signalosome (CSN) complex that cleaves the ubiquitin-like protein Nedd8 from SCF ubiquitin ligases [Maudiozyma saulgeensis]|uniref:Similar to Saccharomyces cerevisiae YOL117W RRI2 Subunit of the COP9 signalosome (CSN) complex that cleaves the ubiquitin-like protein Nedd8 from SCF ubiquitin ligases n=1 Tax=Maudiozyma saulgeensis TaxID=1789683 RepID=A0A1X7RA28_9SACH|nr:similar to Saccharomyces cerevisiae YOL117W RRI2 Subunit of the COP9 signalosome (CSN) complex that cleaves the ubiquitin-like protein Nedd8 from SCF ubiquitin ligases [Kazachstania saulgeensis]